MSSWRQREKARKALEESKPKIPQMLMIRHFERIDMLADNDLTNKQVKERWIPVNEINQYQINPFLDQENAKDSLRYLATELETNTIDYIVCSPFSRCIQTAILILNNATLNITNRNIHINKNLGEFISPAFHFEIPINSEKIYNFSKYILSNEMREYEGRYNLIDDKRTIIFDKYETPEDYDKRICDELKLIRKQCPDGNILVITHADAYTQFNLSREKMDFGKIYKINIHNDSEAAASTDAEGGLYYQKYLKYKAKYLELNKIGIYN